MINKKKIVNGVGLILSGLGADASDEGTRDTPRRVAEMYAELCAAPKFKATAFPNDEGYDQLITVKGIPFYSLCEHHLIPFFGTAAVGYIPSKSYLGLSKVARCVEYYARRLQVQERLTEQIANWFDGNLEPVGVGVVIRARHLCMEMRGVQKPGSETITTAVRGALMEDARARSEFMETLK